MRPAPTEFKAHWERRKVAVSLLNPDTLLWQVETERPVEGFPRPWTHVYEIPNWQLNEFLAIAISDRTASRKLVERIRMHYPVTPKED